MNRNTEGKFQITPRSIIMIGCSNNRLVERMMRGRLRGR
jgi:hypothetical protein